MCLCLFPTSADPSRVSKVALSSHNIIALPVVASLGGRSIPYWNEHWSDLDLCIGTYICMYLITEHTINRQVEGGGGLAGTIPRKNDAKRERPALR